MRTQSLTLGPIEWVLLVVLSLLWGTTFFFVEVALRELPPFTVVLARVSIAATVLTIAAFAAGYRLPTDWKGWAPFLVMATLNGWLPFSLIFWGQTQLTSAVTAILNATVPLFAVVLAHYLTQDERMQLNRLLGVLIGIGGVSVMFGRQILGGFDATLMAQLAVLLANFFYALSAIFAKRFKTVPPLVSAVCQMICATVIILPVALAYDRPWALPAPGLTTIGALLGLGIIATAIAYIIYFRILATAGATNLLLVTLLIPVTAIMLGVLVLGEEVALRHVFGMGIIAVGLLVTDGRPVRQLMRTARPRGSLDQPELGG